MDAKTFVTTLNELAPGLGDFLVESPLGSILSRPGLDLRTREIAIVGTLTALGHAPDQLRTHIGCALNVGVTRVEIVEVIVQTSIYAGMPATLNALAIAKDVFAGRGDR
jgi:4-carboxymuconolactone decarboxylase